MELGNKEGDIPVFGEANREYEKFQRVGFFGIEALNGR